MTPRGKAYKKNSPARDNTSSCFSKGPGSHNEAKKAPKTEPLGTQNRKNYKNEHRENNKNATLPKVGIEMKVLFRTGRVPQITKNPEDPTKSAKVAKGTAKSFPNC